MPPTTIRIQLQGFTLVELMVVITILAVIVTLAAPNMADFVDRRRVVSATEDVTSLLQQGRSEAVKQSRNIRATIIAGAAGSWFVGLSEGNINCTNAATCVVNMAGTPVVKWINASSGDYPGVALATTANNATFNDRGLAVGGPNTDITLTSERGRQLRVTINAIGRVSLCAPSAATNPGAYSICSS